MASYLDFVSDASFRRPRFFSKSAWLQHASFAFWLVETLRPRIVVELGTHTGFSYFAFCQAVVEAGLSSRCFAVDTWTGDEHAGFYDTSVFDAVSAYDAAHYACVSTLVRGTFDAALPAFASGSIDLLHIDGRHFEADVRHDFESWSDRLAPGAIVLFHDTAEAGRGFGVHRVFADLAARHPTFAFTHGSGLGVLGWGSPLHPALAALFAAPPDVAEDVRTAYEALGRTVEVEQRFRSGEPLRRPVAVTGRPAVLRSLGRRLRRPGERG